MMGLKPGMRVLDVGCGVGGPAREIAGFAGVTIVGLNNNDFQIQRANAKTRKAGLAGQVSFAKGDFMKLAEQFGENSFDAGEWRLVGADCSLRYRGHLPCSYFRGGLRGDLQGAQAGRYREFKGDQC
jgi:SAM-dependent methyltransferase